MVTGKWTDKYHKEPENDRIQDYLSRLSAPKLSVHLGEHAGGTNMR